MQDQESCRKQVRGRLHEMVEVGQALLEQIADYERRVPGTFLKGDVSTLTLSVQAQKTILREWDKALGIGTREAVE